MASGEIVAAHSVLLLGVADDWLDGGAAFHLSLTAGVTREELTSRFRCLRSALDPISDIPIPAARSDKLIEFSQLALPHYRDSQIKWWRLQQQERPEAFMVAFSRQDMRGARLGGAHEAQSMASKFRSPIYGRKACVRATHLGV